MDCVLTVRLGHLPCAFCERGEQYLGTVIPLAAKEEPERTRVAAAPNGTTRIATPSPYVEGQIQA
jgi:hypothetical protein